jgi:uncharacterized UBP type Zn finger protein
MVSGAATTAHNGEAPPCDHVDTIRQVQPDAGGCRDCVADGNRWLGLWLCLWCGWVACSDESPNRHARAHYEETDHPLVAALEAVSSWRWCFVHQRVI